LAYVSDESGRADVYVQPYPGPGRKIRMSRDGGTQPVWSRDGRELYYMQGDGLFAVSVNPAGELSPAAPRLLFKKKIAAYDTSPDGRFLIIEDLPSESISSPIAVVINWFPELDARLQSRPR